MDAAEKWLKAADPDYERTSLAWKHVRETGEYRAPREEILVGGLQEVSELADDGALRVGNVTAQWDKLCERCGDAFEPREAAQKFCGDICRAAARREYKRDHERARRQAA